MYLLLSSSIIHHTCTYSLLYSTLNFPLQAGEDLPLSRMYNRWHWLWWPATQCDCKLLGHRRLPQVFHISFMTLNQLIDSPTKISLVFFFFFFAFFFFFFLSTYIFFFWFSSLHRYRMQEICSLCGNISIRIHLPM